MFTAASNLGAGNASRLTAVARRLFPVRGENQTTESVRNEMLSQFDSCLCVTICEEFIEIAGAQMLSSVLNETQKSKIFSVSMDSTRDVAHVDRLTFNINNAAV